MLHYGLDEHLGRMRRRYRNYDRWYKFATYLTKRVPTLLRKPDRLHPDLWMEVEGKLNGLPLMIWDTPELNGEAERQGLPRSWVVGEAPVIKQFVYQWARCLQLLCIATSTSIRITVSSTSSPTRPS